LLRIEVPGGDGATPIRSRIVKFGTFKADLNSGELEHPQQIVTREEFQQRIWSEDIYRFMASVKEISVEADVAEQAAVQIPLVRVRKPIRYPGSRSKAKWVSENQEYRNIGEMLP